MDNPNFQQMIGYCNQKAQLISRRTLGHDIQKLYESLFQQVHTKLGSHCKEGGRVSITLDAWSSTTRVPFLGITGHYIDKSSSKFQSILLGFERLRGSHTAESLSRVCLAVLERFHLVEHIRGITTDNASTNTKMLRLLARSLPGFNAKDDHIRCMAHVINLAVQELLSHLRVTASEHYDNLSVNQQTGIDRIPQVFAKARRIISKIRASNLLWESFEAQTLAAKLPALKLVLDMPVRYVIQTSLVQFYYLFKIDGTQPTICLIDSYSFGLQFMQLVELKNFYDQILYLMMIGIYLLDSHPF